MDQTEPMPNLMYCRSSPVVVCHLTTGYGLSLDAASIRGECFISRVEVSRELTIAKYATAKVG